MSLDARAFPLFAVRPLDWQPVARETIDALLLGSANALRHGGAALERYRGLPAYAVGERTAEAAREAGLDVILTGSGGLQGVLGRIDPAHRRLLRLAGRERIVLDLPPSLSITTREVYASEALPLSDRLKALLAKPAIVLLHSGEAAAHFAGACAEAGINRAAIRLAALGPRIAEAAGFGWAAIAIATEPNDAALLALARDLCQGFTPGS
ncbi:uroporphyrinogen-III synthase [Novosphingobium sp. BL-8H]|uniref:uroporphyrinogen-III synthase n=1 Tax=Novosphingobium sp. BL-8H TaxID=3127640 RepID=UPI003757C225